METEHAAVERIVVEVKRNVVREVYRKVGRIDVAEAGVQVLYSRVPPLDVNVRPVDSTGALDHRALTARNDDGDGVVDDRNDPEMVRARAGLVELRPHRRVLKLELIACVILRKDSARTSDE